MASVAGEKIVAACAGKQHFHAIFPREFADVQNIERCRIGERLIELPDHALEVASHAIRLDFDRVEPYTEVLGDTLRIRKIVGHAFFRTTNLSDREALQIRCTLAGKCDHRARIQPTREKRANRNIRNELALDGSTDVLRRALDRFALAEVLHHPPKHGQLIPRPAPFDASFAEHHRLTGKQLAYVLQRRTFTRTPQATDVPVQRYVINRARLGHKVEEPLDLAAIRDTTH